jgi:N-acyl-D-aspartate/D-glutamate deacylase
MPVDLLIKSGFVIDGLGGPRRRADVADWATKVIVETTTPQTKLYEGRVVGDIASEEARRRSTRCSTFGDDSARHAIRPARGAGKLYSETVGIDHVVVNGEKIIRGGDFTDRRPGRLLRSGFDTRTPSLK